METTTPEQNQPRLAESVKILSQATHALWGLQSAMTTAERRRCRQALAEREAPSLKALLAIAAQTKERQLKLLQAIRESRALPPSLGLLSFWELERLLETPALPRLPLCLSYLGNPNVLLRPRVGIIGSRHPTYYGRMQAERFSRTLAQAGVAVISGGAIGIDTVANAAASAHGASVAVLGSGLDAPYPPSNTALFRKMAASTNGLLLSEFAESQRAERWTFPERNLTIAGLSDFVLVVEAGERSGCRHTVEAALELGIDVGALPGPVDSPCSVGTNVLIRDGAFPILNPEDILERLSRRRQKTQA